MGIYGQRLFVNWSTFYKKIQQKDRFAPVDSNAKTGSAVMFAICHENSGAMHILTDILRPASSL